MWFCVTGGGLPGPLQPSVTSVFASPLCCFSCPFSRVCQVPGYLCLLLLLQCLVMERNWKNYLLLAVTVCTITRTHAARGLLWTYSAFPPMPVWIHLFSTLGTPSLGFYPLTFSLSLVKLLADPWPARRVRSCQVPSNTEEYCANTTTSWVPTVSPWFSAELSSPHLPVLSQDSSCDGTGGTLSPLLCFSWRGRTSPMLFCQLENTSNLVNVCFLLPCSVSQGVFWLLPGCTSLLVFIKDRSWFK